MSRRIPSRTPSASSTTKTPEKVRQQDHGSTGQAPEDDQAHRRPYHHGALPEALLQAAETVLHRDGLRGLSLRAIAREAGVSHTAPKHHFGDTAGMLSELAATGHWRLAMEMAAQARMLPPGRERRGAVAQGYVRFGAQNPDLLRLMSRHELLDMRRPALRQAMRVSARALLGIFDAPAEQAEPFAGISAAQAVTVAAAWGYVHGLSTLLIDGQLAAIATGGGFGDATALVEAALARIHLSLDEPGSAPAPASAA